MMNIPALIIAACFAIPACTLLATFLVRPDQDQRHGERASFNHGDYPHA